MGGFWWTSSSLPPPPLEEEDPKPVFKEILSYLQAFYTVTSILAPAMKL